MELHQNVDKFLHLREKVVENSRLAPQFLPSPRPNLPAITDSPEGGANLLVGGPIYWSLRYFFNKDGVLRFISAFVTITVFKTKSESAWIKSNAHRRGTVNKSPG